MKNKSSPLFIQGETVKSKPIPHNRSIVILIHVLAFLVLSTTWFVSCVEQPKPEVSPLLLLTLLWLCTSTAMAAHWIKNTQFDEKISPLASSMARVAFSQLWSEFPMFTLFLSRAEGAGSAGEALDYSDRSKILTVGEVLRDKLTLASSTLAVFAGAACLAMATELFPLEFARRVVGTGPLLCFLKLVFSLVAINFASIGILGLARKLTTKEE